MPVLTASAPMSVSTDSAWVRMASSGRGQTPWTPSVFWAVTAVTAVVA